MKEKENECEQWKQWREICGWKDVKEKGCERKTFGSFENLVNVKNYGDIIVMCIEVIKGEGMVDEQEKIKREEVMKRLKI